ncbi:aminopeptidase N [Leekyejoonella antrihumi]|uniref:Aminopeptidase N n=2 Tax=Leekyejoonella antrihumi TaxID=1660198 RepID=A0A563E581_9MICO|nr:aminopeptidase N [Leekyejoonella antrihumi]TWP37449.1 aminopeptidase N [Leekyejoonella antrihumi]
MAILQRSEAQQRSSLIDVTAYDIALDLDRGPDTFESVSTITFTSRTPGGSTFLDVKASAVESITMNGSSIDPARVSDERLTLADLAADNTVVVRATMSYGRDGQGLHRSVDNADGKAYIYGMSFLDAGPQIFACFDQPDLKAPYDVRVRAPKGWMVAGNGAATQTAPGEWTLATTKPMATYYMTVCAGPYATVADEHDGIPLRIHARASLGRQLIEQAEDLFRVTKQGFDYYHGLFGIRYPWGEYHQFFVPEFNAGAMENPGCVTLRDQYIFRGRASQQELLTRANTVTHEMAHMWFGDLVTMKWWDDLWLNESFAEYMAHRTCVEATEYTGAWVDMGIVRKNWGYAADRAPSTHPVAGSPAPDSDSALANFDGISYAKGASALRQLVAYVGDEAFLAGVRDHLETHAYGNATFAQFLASMEKSSGRPLDTWAHAWLGTPGADRLALDIGSVEDNIVSAVLTRRTPEPYPAERPHVLEVAGFTDGAPVWRERIELSASEQRIDSLVGQTLPKVVVPNVSDLTWATVVFDDGTLDQLPDQLPGIRDDDARQVIWSGLLGGMAHGTVDPRTVLDVFVAAWPTEDHQSIIATVADMVRSSLPGLFLPPEESDDAVAALGGAAQRMLDRLDPATTSVIPAARLLVSTSTDEARLGRWMAGEDLPTVLEGDQDFRWAATRRLASLDLIGDAQIDAQLEQDNTMSGVLAALSAKAYRPVPSAKAWAWSQLTTDTTLSAYQALAIASTFFRSTDLEVVRPYQERYFTQIPPLADHLGEFAVARIATACFPLTLVETSTVQAANQAVAHETMTAGVRRSMTDQLSVLQEALRSRRLFPKVA